MNKLKTIGISALAGSLAAFSAQAFEASGAFCQMTEDDEDYINFRQFPLGVLRVSACSLPG